VAAFERQRGLSTTALAVPSFVGWLTWLEGRGRQRAQRRGDLQQPDGRDLRYERGIGGSIEEDMWGVFFISAQDEATDTDRVIP
jgi:hypothetical protein